MTGPTDPSNPPSQGQERGSPSPAVPEDRDALFAELSHRLDEADRSPLWRARALPTWTRLGVAAGGVSVVAFWVFFAAPRADWAVHPELRMGVALGLLVTSTLGVLVLALRPLHRPAPGVGRTWLAVLAAVGLVFGLAALPPAHTALAVSVPAGPVHVHALPCLLFGLAVGLPLFVILRVLDRGTVLGPLLAAGAAGLVGNLALQLHCPITLPSHRLAGHATVALVFVAAAAVAWAARRARR